MTNLPHDLKGSSCWKLMAHMDEIIASEVTKGERMDVSLIEWATAMRRAASNQMTKADWEVTR